MLGHIHIENFILIDQLSLDLSKGLTMITGETGAGKSILLGAIGLIQGNRADLSAIRNTNRKCIIEAHFEISNLGLKQLFDTYDLDYEKTTIIRREILPSGKSRAFVNDTPVKLSVLSDLGGYLIDVHSQHQTLELGKDTFQMDVLHSYVMHATKDATDTAAALLNNYQTELNHLKASIKLLQQLQEDEARLTRESDYNQFLLDELDHAQLEQADVNALEIENDQLSNVEFIKEKIEYTNQLLNVDEVGVLEQLRSLYNSLKSISAYKKSYADYANRVNSVLLELEDLNVDLSDAGDELEVNPERLQQVNETLATIENLYKKHQKDSVVQLIELRDQLADTVFESQGIHKKIDQLQQQIETSKKALHEIGHKLSELRSQHAPELANEISHLVHQLGMPDALFEIEVVKTDQFLSQGMDQVHFKFTANKGMPLQLLQKAASGGELSRLMLAIKSLFSRYKKLPTIIFDEIDTGVSGNIADQMAQIMKAMSLEMQVLAITHLPQIAAAGNTHLKVAKVEVNQTTISQIKELNAIQRVEEIAQMLSAGNVSDAARENARVLLG